MAGCGEESFGSHDVEMTNVKLGFNRESGYGAAIVKGRREHLRRICTAWLSENRFFRLNEKGLA